MLNTITKSYTFRGEERIAIFREQTVRDAQRLKKDQEARVERKEEGGSQVSMIIDVEKETQRSYLRLSLTLVGEDGKLVYPTVEKLMNEPAAYIEVLARLAKEAEDEFAESAGK